MLLKNTLSYVMGVMDTQGDVITELHTTLNDRSTSSLCANDPGKWCATGISNCKSIGTMRCK